MVRPLRRLRAHVDSRGTHRRDARGQGGRRRPAGSSSACIGARGFADRGPRRLLPVRVPRRGLRGLRAQRARDPARRALGALPLRERRRRDSSCSPASASRSSRSRSGACARGTTCTARPARAHALIGAGDGPCAILMVGARKPEATIHYPVSEAAAAPRPVDAGGERRRARGVRQRGLEPRERARRGCPGRAADSGRRGAAPARPRGAERRREVAARHDVDAARARASAAIAASSARSSAAVSGGASGSACAACTRSAPALAVGLEVHARDQPVAEQERQHVVAVHALGRGHVDLDPVAEAEQPLDARALPHQRVERARRARARRRAAAAAPPDRGSAGARQPSTSTGHSSPASTSSATRALARRRPAAGSSRAGRARWRRRARARRRAAARAAPPRAAASARRAPRRAARARAGRRGARTRAAART